MWPINHDELLKLAAIRISLLHRRAKCVISKNDDLLPFHKLPTRKQPRSASVIDSYGARLIMARGGSAQLSYEEYRVVSCKSTKNRGRFSGSRPDSGGATYAPPAVRSFDPEQAIDGLMQPQSKRPATITQRQNPHRDRLQNDCEADQDEGHLYRGIDRGRRYLKFRYNARLIQVGGDGVVFFENADALPGANKDDARQGSPVDSPTAPFRRNVGGWKARRLWVRIGTGHT